MTAHSKDDGMREALLAAQRIADGWQRSLSQSGYWEESDPLTVANALLSSSAAASGVVGALTPSADTKAAYHGEFKFTIYEKDEDGEEWPRMITVPWTVVKDIMAKIADRAGLSVSVALSSSRSAGGSEVATRAEDGPTAPISHGNKDRV